jgi:LEA14-like dessication related protein
MITKKNILSFILLSILFVQCIKLPEISDINSVRIMESDNSELQMEIVTEIHNSNRVAATVNQIDCKIFIENRLIGTAQKRTPTKIKARKKSLIPLNVNVDLENLSQVFPKIFEHNTTVVTVEGKYRIKTGRKSIKLPITSEETINFKEQLNDFFSKEVNNNQFSLSDIKISQPSISFEKTKGTLSLIIKNDFPIDYELKKINLNLFIEDNEEAFGTWQIKDSIKILSEAQEIIDANIEIKNKNLIKQIFQNGLSKELEVIAKGEATIMIEGHSFSIPVEQKSDLKASLNGFWKN